MAPAVTCKDARPGPSYRKRNPLADVKNPPVFSFFTNLPHDKPHRYGQKNHDSRRTLSSSRIPRPRSEAGRIENLSSPPNYQFLQYRTLSQKQTSQKQTSQEQTPTSLSLPSRPSPRANISPNPSPSAIHSPLPISLGVKDWENLSTRHGHSPLGSAIPHCLPEDQINQSQASDPYLSQEFLTSQEIPPPNFDIANLWAKVRTQIATMTSVKNAPTKSIYGNPYVTGSTSCIKEPDIVPEGPSKLKGLLEDLVSTAKTSPLPKDFIFTIQLQEDEVSRWAALYKEWINSRTRTVDDIHFRLRTKLFADPDLYPKDLTRSWKPVEVDPTNCQQETPTGDRTQTCSSPERLELSCRSSRIHKDLHGNTLYFDDEERRPQTFIFGLAMEESLPGIPPSFLANVMVPGCLDSEHDFFADFLYVIVGKDPFEDMRKIWASRARRVLANQLSIQRGQKEDKQRRAAIIQGSDYFGYIVRESTVQIWKMECRLPPSQGRKYRIPSSATAAFARIPTSETPPTSQSSQARARSENSRKARSGLNGSQRAALTTGSDHSQRKTRTEFLSDPSHATLSKPPSGRAASTVSNHAKPSLLPVPPRKPTQPFQGSPSEPAPTSSQGPTDTKLCSTCAPLPFFEYKTYGPVVLSLESVNDLKDLRAYHHAIISWAQIISCPRNAANLYRLLKQRRTSLDYVMREDEIMDYWEEAMGGGPDKEA